MQEPSLQTRPSVSDHAGGASSADPLAGLHVEIHQLQRIGAEFHRRGWSVGTSSNYSVVVRREPLELLVTASGKDKGQLGPRDFVRVAADGRPAVAGQPKSSAETLLHVVLAELPDVGAVLHTHSVWGTELSNLFFDQGAIRIEGYEMLKGLAGVTTHEYRWDLPIFENTQDIPALAEQVRQRLQSNDPLRHGFLIRRHGLYTWGVDLAEARRHIEIIEFLLECVARRRQLDGHGAG